MGVKRFGDWEKAKAKLAANPGARLALAIRQATIKNAVLLVREIKRGIRSQAPGGKAFVKLAESYGHVGVRIDRPADVEPALREAFTAHKDRLVFLDIITDQTENVWPMVKAGRGLTEMLLGSEDL